MEILIEIPQQHIAISINYYSAEEKEKLNRYPTGKKIEELEKSGINIPTAEFLTYYLFHRKRQFKPGYRNYKELGRRINWSLQNFHDWIQFNGQSINLAQDIGEPDTNITELVGESVALSVVNRIHDITEADWGRIPMKRGPNAPSVLDYEHKESLVAASDSSRIIQVEAKGSSVKDNRKIPYPSAIVQHKYKISKKKRNIEELTRKNKYPFPANLRYGTITALDSRKDSIIKCILVDPESSKFEIDPYKRRLINRLMFLWNWISFIRPRSQLAASLATRVKSIINVKDIRSLDGVPLLNGEGEPFSYISSGFNIDGRCSFFASKSYITDGPAGGVVLRLSDQYLLFLGIREDLIFQAVEQKFKEIIAYKADSASIDKTVRCVISKGRYEELELPETIQENVRKKGEYRVFDLKGQLHYSKGGIVFGFLLVS